MPNLARFFYDVLLLDQGSAVVPTGLVATLAAGPQVNLDWDITGITSEDHYSIERLDATAAGSFAEIATVGANISTYAGDAGPFTARHRYAYRVVVVGGPSDGEMTNEVAVLGPSQHVSRLRRQRYSH